MKTTFRRHNTILRNCVTAAVALALTATAAVAAVSDLPVKSVNGRQMHYYVVQKGETVYSLTHKLGITHDQLVKANKAVEDGLRAGQVLYFPLTGAESATGSASSNGMSGTIDTPDFRLHTVTKGETLYGVSHRYGVPVADIIRLNPGAENGLKAGQSLKVPVAKKQDGNTQPAAGQTQAAATAVSETTGAGDKIEPLPEPTLELTPVKPEIVALRDDAPGQDKSDFDVPMVRRHRIAVMLPLNAGSEAQASRQSTLATDFYRGALLAVNDFGAECNDSVDLHVYDTATADISKQVSALKGYDIVISPDDDSKLAQIAAYTGSRGISVFNSFIVKDSTYITTPGMMQSYIGQERMYAKTIDYLASILSEANAPKPVILDNENGRKDKLPFVTRLKERLDRDAIAYTTINFDGNLHKNILEENLPTTSSYFMITMSGSLAEYNKVSSGLSAFAEDLAANGNSLTTFGYPEWISFRGDAQEKLSQIGALYYSRFYVDKEGEEAKHILNDFRRWFGKSPADGIPVQALLGYDTARYILTALHNGSITTDEPYHGVQSSYHFLHTPEIEGLVNDALYIVRYMPGATSPVITVL